MNKWAILKAAVNNLKASKFPQEDVFGIACFVKTYFTEYEIRRHHIVRYVWQGLPL